MTEIERKALELVNEAAAEFVVAPWTSIDRRSFLEDVICRAIEQHEAFRKEVSDAVEAFYKRGFYIDDQLSRFIIAKPDPLVEAIRECWHSDKILEDRFRAALAKRGLEIREKSDDE